MTLDEAIEHAEEVADKQNEIAFELNTTYNAVTEYSKECSKCAEDHRQLAEWLKDYKRLKEREPCEDAVSRKAVLNYIYNDLGLGDEENGKDVERQIELERSYKYVKSLPPVTPQPKMGHLIDTSGGVECDKCGKWYPHAPIAKNTIKFCSECGSKIVEPQESEKEVDDE